ncbi:MAG: VWA domain-containing protein [Candidatus Hydrothermae bacterium]|nr:VWA domain-containing protein [Candidatus Hydrothermae bacterium]
MPVVRVILRPHRQALLRGVEQPQKIFVMLKFLLRKEMTHERPEIAFALVVDTSTSMKEGGKLDQAIQAIEQLLDYPELVPTDQVSVVKFDDTGQTLVPLTPIGEKGMVLQGVHRLKEFEGGTEIAKGLQLALDQLSALPPTVVRKVFLLTDGYTYEEEEALKLAEVYFSQKIPIVALGLGTEYHEEFLIRLTDITRGRVYHLEDMFLLPAIFYQEVGMIAREVVTDLVMQCETGEGVRLISLSRVYPNLLPIPPTPPYHMGNLVNKDYTVYVAEFGVSPPFEGETRKIGTFRWSYYIPTRDQREELSSREVSLPLTDDVELSREIDDEVMAYVEQRNIENLIREAVTRAQVDPDGAANTLKLVQALTQKLGNEHLTQVLNRAMQELQTHRRITESTAKTLRIDTRTKTQRAATRVLDPEILEELQEEGTAPSNEPEHDAPA